MINLEMHQFLIERRSIRRFEHRPIPVDKLYRIIETALWIGSVTNKDLLIQHFGIPEGLEIFSIIASGYPNESPKMVPVGKDYRPYRRDGQLFVPKYSVTDKVRFDRWQ